MRVAFIIPAELSRSGRPEVATGNGRVLIATTPEQVGMVPLSWIRLDLNGDGMISVVEWLASGDVQ